jgi:hypothetical protein
MDLGPDWIRVQFERRAGGDVAVERFPNGAERLHPLKAGTAVQGCVRAGEKPAERRPGDGPCVRSDEAQNLALTWLLLDEDLATSLGDRDVQLEHRQRTSDHLSKRLALGVHLKLLQAVPY